MNTSTSHHGGETAELNANLRHWKELLRQLPEIRLDKVNDARRALAQDQYDDDGVIEVTIDRLHGEMRNAS